LAVLPGLLLRSCHNVKEIDLNLTFPVKSENLCTPPEAVLAGGRRQKGIMITALEPRPKGVRVEALRKNI